MTSTTAKFLITFAIAISFSGCATSAHPRLDPPPRELFEEYDAHTWELAAEACKPRTPADDPMTPTEAIACAFVNEAQKNIAADDLKCKRYIRRTEERIRIHNAESE